MINSLSSKWLKKMFVCLFLRANKKKMFAQFQTVNAQRSGDDGKYGYTYS